jgi:hypothetical protein
MATCGGVLRQLGNVGGGSGGWGELELFTAHVPAMPDQTSVSVATAEPAWFETNKATADQRSQCACGKQDGESPDLDPPPPAVQAAVPSGLPV